ncbi:alpha/beta hydrolase [Candidatus Sororendozoicomonas aggregata]|uniref:alpha/beta hydrolase n=1 Tax=Candidatus Sororendozoicomonas aggregata TaxID=3073239 RepID=UPI002ED06AA5
MRQNIAFLSHDQNISGHLYCPEKFKAPLPVVILCHTFCGVKDWLLPSYAIFFAQNGYAALTFDYRGFGQSQGESGRFNTERQVEDILAAIDYIKCLDFIDADRIALWGSFFGGANAIVAAACDKRVKCLIAQLPFADGSQLLTHTLTEADERRFYQTLARMQNKKVTTGREMVVPISKVLTDSASADFYKEHREQFPSLGIKIPYLSTAEILSLKPEQYIKDITAPILLVGAEHDAVNPAGAIKRLYDLAQEPKKLHTETGAAHYEMYSGKCFLRCAKQQQAWLDQYC